MHIITPTEIESVAWEGELIAPATITRTIHPSERPTVTIGRHELWTVEDLENLVNQKWVRPMGNADYWLLRLACTLHEPPGRQDITEAQQTLYLRPKSELAGDNAAYAFSLFPDRLGVEDKVELNISLGPELKFASGAEFKAGQLGAKIEYSKVFPVIQSYGVGESIPYWLFKPHAKHPLEGSQFVYAVVAAMKGADGISASVDLRVTAETKFGPVRFGMPKKARAYTGFTIP